MTTEIIPLGTASAVPTRDRHLSATALRRAGRVLLFDCGEGTQFRLVNAEINRARIDAVFITHFHGDHFYGLPGLVSTMALMGRRDPLTIVGPAGIQAAFHCIPGLNPGWLPFALSFVELAEDFEHAVVYETPDFFVEARPIEHRIFTAGYRFQERPRLGRLDVEKARALGVTDFHDYRRLKSGEAVTLPDGRIVRPQEVVGPSKPGASFAYVTDTRPCEGGRRLGKGADILYHEATFGSEYQANAVEMAHATAREAAEVARDAGARRLLIGHFSARYPEPSPLVEEARQVFQNTDAAEELKRYPLRADG